MVGRGIRGPEYLNLLSLELNGLSSGGGCHQVTHDTNTRACGDQLKRVFRNCSGIDDYLQIGESAAIVDLNKVDFLAVAPRLDPAVRSYRVSRGPP